ncbi:MAG: alpha/beta fold hydrolase, partial [Chloroflexota bacterium]
GLIMHHMENMPEDLYINVNSVRTRYWVMGDGPPVILVHGILRFAEEWMLNLATLAQNYRVYVPDLIGHGKTDKPEIDYRFDQLTGFLNDFMETMGIERATLVGHSMGGGICLGHTLLHPEKVDKLILVSSAGFGRDVHAALRLATIPLLAKVLSKPRRLIISQAFRQILYDHSLITDELVDFAYEMFYLPGAREAVLKLIQTNLTLGGLRRELLDEVDEALPTLEAPTLLIWGRQDPVIPSRHSYKAIEWIKNAQLRILDECAHFPMWEHPEVFNALVQEFIHTEIAPVPLPEPDKLSLSMAY